MTKKRFIKLITAVWHKWTMDTHGNFKKDLPLKMFLERHTRRAKKIGFLQEYEITKKRFLPYEN
jgi:hypothetical protein